jgi:Ca2+/H+ antiporter, TMEM165/GDT1 family
MAAFLASFLFVVLAEMGDKTQLLAMAFCAKYNWQKVLIGCFLATILNHSLAVAAGRFLAAVVPLDIISFLASLSFIGFGLWTLRGDKLGDEDKKPSRFGPVAAVSVAFFLAEMGDKTQLATISLAVRYPNAVSVLLGTTMGMVVADAVGIIAGVVLRKNIPEKTVKWVSAAVFIVYGLAGCYAIIAR